MNRTRVVMNRNGNRARVVVNRNGNRARKVGNGAKRVWSRNKARSEQGLAGQEP